MLLLDFLLAGLVIGGIYALISVGLNLQYGVARVLNLAYGEFLMLAGYAAFWAFTGLGAPPLLTAVVGAPLAFALSWLLFRYVLHPLLRRTTDQGKREVDSILSTFGLLFLLQGVALVAWTGTDRAYSYLSVPLNLFGAVIGANRLIVLVAALVSSAAVYAFLRYSSAGRAMRAIAVSPKTAPLVGIDVERHSAIAFATGGTLAALAGVLLSSFVSVSPAMGAAYTLNALIVIVMGGIGNVAGGFVAALILGMAQTLAAQLGQSGLGTILTFAIFSIVLLWRPQGLFGSNARSSGRGAPRLAKHLAWIAGLALLLIVPLYANAYWLALAVNILTYIALATGWAFFSGPTRYVSLAASAFFGVGAYSVAVLATDYSYPVALLAAVAISAVLSALVGLATLRLSGMYFVIFTFGLASLVNASVNWWEFNVAKQAGWYLFLSITPTHIYYQLLALCAAIIGLWLLRDRSRMGFALKALGADETVARQVGINTVALKIGTFVVSAVVMTLAGVILAPRRSYMDAGNAFNPDDLIPHGHHGAARRRQLGVGAHAGRRAAGRDPGLPFDRLGQPFQRPAGPGAARHRVLHPERPDRPACTAARARMQGHDLADLLGPWPRACASARLRRSTAPHSMAARRRTARADRDAPLTAQARKTARARNERRRRFPLLEVTGLTRHFGGLAALDGVSFTVGRGEVVGLIGPNGSGKTTLLNVVSGRLSPNAGSVRFDGRDLTGRTPEAVCQAGIAGTFQLARIPDALDARDNVAVAAMYGRRRLDVASARAEADRLLARVGFEGKPSAHGDALPYFDLKRIELARALACAPELLLLDEWLAGLNPTELEAGIALVRSLLDEGLTILMVEHVMHAIRSLCGHIVVLNAGRVIAAGTPDDALAHADVMRVYLGETV